MSTDTSQEKTRFARAIESAGCTYAAAGNAIGVHRTSIMRFADGTLKPGPGPLLTLARYLRPGVPLEVALDEVWGDVVPECSREAGR